jgi:hypothetical protein
MRVFGSLVLAVVLLASAVVQAAPAVEPMGVLVDGSEVRVDGEHLRLHLTIDADSWALVQQRGIRPVVRVALSSGGLCEWEAVQADDEYLCTLAGGARPDRARLSITGAGPGHRLAFMLTTADGGRRHGALPLRLGAPASKLATR